MTTPAGALRRFNAAAAESATALRNLAVSVQWSMDRELAEHPDLAEVDVRLDALYEAP